MKILLLILDHDLCRRHIGARKLSHFSHKNGNLYKFSLKLFFLDFFFLKL